MAKLPYIFQTPIPIFFYKNGFLDPKKKSYTNRIKYLNLHFGKCRSVPTIQRGVSFAPFEFSISDEEGAKEAGLTIKEYKVQKNLHLSKGWLVKQSNSVANRANFYQWKVEKFSEDTIINFEEQNEKGPTDLSFEQKKGPTDLREEICKKGTTDLKKGQPKGGQKGQPIYETNQEEKGQPKGQPKGCIYRTIEQEEVCLKETNINKEKCEVIPAAVHLSLSHEEKEKERKTLEAFFEYKGISQKDISSSTIKRWLNFYPVEMLIATINLMGSSKTTVRKPGAWIEAALQENIAGKEAIKSKNKNFAKTIKEKFKIKSLKITERYCCDTDTGKDYYYHIDPLIFETELKRKYT